MVERGVAFAEGTEVLELMSEWPAVASGRGRLIGERWGWLRSLGLFAGPVSALRGLERQGLTARAWGSVPIKGRLPPCSPPPGPAPCAVRARAPIWFPARTA